MNYREANYDEQSFLMFPLLHFKYMSFLSLTMSCVNLICGNFVFIPVGLQTKNLVRHATNWNIY